MPGGKLRLAFSSVTWLSRYGKVRLKNIAQPGTYSRTFLAQVAVIAMAHRDTDLIIIDYLVNDVGNTEFKNNLQIQNQKRDTILSPVYEVLIRALQDALPG